ncbi:EamA-like transporter family protein [Pseudomonas sp. NFACC32-1]|nr:EamA-like transporter family protein [Pseudomonas sp. NFACC32-1]SFX81581.1 EamA-like transporter family protein [Pseudomonas sp. NFACC47-1]SFX82008.1 EamA-like transporter family protein [Pseudomonas sp. NFACC49-2]SFY04619.1 EamA-like transporter family protein [Pseudomonas sp. NFACC36]SFY30376.1 EamA-like transporter family protein [Pseudomonas sp. NFACC43]
MLLAWSSGFIGARFSVDYAPALLVVFWRCVLVTLLLFPFALPALRQAPVAVLLKNAGIGLLAMAGYLAGITQGIALGVPAGLAALFADLLPIGLALLSAGVLGRRLAWPIWIGLMVGLAGVALVTQSAMTWGDAPAWAYALPLLGMLSLAIATLWQKALAPREQLGLLPNLWLQCAVSGLAFGILEGTQGSLAPIPSVGFALSVAWTAGLSTIGGYGLYWLCLRRASATRITSLLYLSPPITMLWAWAMFDEPLSWQMAAGLAASGLGIWMVVRTEAATRTS